MAINMTTQELYSQRPGGETVFTVPGSSVKFGPGALREVGEDARAMGLQRVALFTDKHVAETQCFATLIGALTDAGVETVVYDRLRVEPTDQSFREAAAFVSEEDISGFVSLGGGSVIDTAKVANLLSCYPDDLMAYVNAPIGQAKAVPGQLKPHIACPTTCGTGSETTGVAVFDLVASQVKTGISSHFMRPALAVVDPLTTDTLPPGVIAATGFDVLTHALESFTARPYTSRDLPAPGTRPPYQGANPFSDLGALAAIRLGGQHLVRAVTDPNAQDSRHHLMFAATLAGQAFGNAGVHIPHAMSYSVAGLNHTHVSAGYEKEMPQVPHGVSVVINAPSAFRYIADDNPDRLLEAARALGADVSDATAAEGGELLGTRLAEMMKMTGLPNGLNGLKYSDADIPALVEGAMAQQRLLAQSPRTITAANLADIYKGAMHYW